MNNQTKIQALTKQIDSGQLKTDSAKILDFIKKEGFSSLPIICDALGMPEKTVSARLSGLQDLGILEIVPYKENVPQYQIYTFQPVKKIQIYNAYKRKEFKFHQWKKRGLKEFPEFLKEIEYNLLA